MTNLFDTLITAARNRARYIRTHAALAQLPLDSLLDLDIYDIKATAKRAVWG